MDSQTKFASCLSYTSSNPEDVVNFVADHKAELVPCFSEDLIHEWDSGSNQFRLKMGQESFELTYPAYLAFVQRLGIPPRFAEKIPNPLLVECVDKMLDDSNLKLQLKIRDKNVICGVHRDKQPIITFDQLFEGTVALTQSHLLREISVGDDEAAIFLEPLQFPCLTPNPNDPQDQYNAGISLKTGGGAGLIELLPYSHRQYCGNVALTSRDQSKTGLVEKLRPGKVDRAYDRLLDNYNHEDNKRYREMAEFLNRALVGIMGKKLQEWEYDSAFTQTRKLLGKEVAFALFGTDPEEHKQLMEEIRFHKSRDEFGPEHNRETRFDAFEVFDHLTAAAKGYTGVDRITLQAIGGSLL